MSKKSDPILIRNFDLLKRLFDNTDILSRYYKLSNRDIDLLHQLCMKHTSYCYYIETKTKEFKESRRVIYRAIDKLENENIITVVGRPKNQYDTLKVYFTVSFINKMCGEEFAELYEKWLNWQKSYREEKKGEEN